MFVSIAVDYWRSRALGRIAEKYDSQALQADALHFSTDIWSSAVVVLGLAVVLAGRKLRIPWLIDADPVAALFVAGVIMFVSTRLARKTIDALLDTAPTGARSKIIASLSKIDGVLEVDRVRIRRAGNRYFADVSVGLSRNVTFQRSGQVADEVTNAVHGVLPNTDVVVHSIPRAASAENIFDRVRAVATRHNLNVHDVSIQDLDGRLHVEQHLEIDEQLPLKEAHDRVSDFDGSEIREEVPEIASILTHIESEPATIEAGRTNRTDARSRRTPGARGHEFPEIFDIHDLEVKRVRDHVYVSCHCTFADDLPLSRVHDLSTALEIRFKQEAPNYFVCSSTPSPAPIIGGRTMVTAKQNGPRGKFEAVAGSGHTITHGRRQQGWEQSHGACVDGTLRMHRATT